MNTGLYDKNGKPINIGDRTRLILQDGEIREFDVCFKTVNRTTVKTWLGFEPETAEVSITGIFFCWNGIDLLPCVDGDGISDVSKMEVIQNTSMIEDGAQGNGKRQGRLIDEGKLLEDFTNTITRLSDTFDWLNMISRQPTAYDVDKVVERLDKASDYYECDEQGREHVQMVDLIDAIEIVRTGGDK